MALTAYGRNYVAETLGKEKMKFVTLFEARVDKPTSGTAIGASLINMTGSKANGYTNGKVVVIETLTASVTGLVAKRPYFIVGEATNGFELSETEGGAAIKVAGHELETGTEIALLKEEVAVARLATAFGAGSGDVAEDAERKIKVKAGKKVRYAGWFEVSGVATGKPYSVEKLTEEESFGAEGEYNLTSDKLEAPPTVA